ncbi:hypothetical protein ACIP5Y_24215 [Nocardia sp. NPDC088792]|uniref:hypothetical protein n=1 Tax=Nocardia sp. NPDC088792 TaxID=3364332 RepID=UPI00382E6FB5
MSSNSLWSVQAITERIEREGQQAAEVGCVTSKKPAARYSVRGLWSCSCDPGELTATQAHIAMQLHLECGVHTCRVRSRARNTLVSAGQMVLDTRATRAPAAARKSLFGLLQAAVFGCSALFLGGRHALR